MRYRDRIDMEELLRYLAVPFERQGHNLRALCPNPDHIDHEPSWTIVDAPGTPKHGGHRCFSCHFGGGPWELVMAVRGLDEEGAAEFVNAFVQDRPRRFPGVPSVRVRMPAATREYQLPPAVHVPCLDGTEWPDAFAEYLERRDVTSAQVEQWHMGYATRGRLAWRVVIPVHTRGRLVAHVGRAIFRDRERYDMPWSSNGALPSFAVLGEPLLDPSIPCVTIAEGSFSMLALQRAGAPNPVALLGSDWSVDRAAILTAYRWKHVLVATDPDKAGDRVARSIEMSFRRTEVSRLRLGQSPDDAQQTELRAAIIAALGSGV